MNFSVSQNQMARIRNEVAAGRVALPKDEVLQVSLLLSDGSPYPEKGKIDFSDPSFSQDTGAFLVRAVIPNPKRALRPGMFVTARVEGIVRPGAIVVPQLAVQQGPQAGGARRTEEVARCSRTSSSTGRSCHRSSRC